MNTKEVLIAAKAKIADPKNWTKGAYARDANGFEPLRPDDAVCWCAAGALRLFNSDYSMAWRYLEIANYQGVIYVNDFLGHDAVMKMYDKAIELADAAS